MGLAPDNDDNGPSYLTSLRNLSLINNLIVSIRMASMNTGVSRIVFGGYDTRNMMPFPSASNPKFYWYDNVHDDKEWGVEMRNILINETSIDSGFLTYAKIDSFMPFIQLTPAFFRNYANYMNTTHPEMRCQDFLGFGICSATNITCDKIVQNYSNITIRFNDSYGF